MRPIKISIGATFHYWTVIENPITLFKNGKSRRFIRCKCKCGKERIHEVKHFNKRSESCGCKKRETNIKVGNIFNYLTVTSEPYYEYRGEKATRLFHVVKCKCVCGKEKSFKIVQLKNNLKSCGCRKNENRITRKTHGDSKSSLYAVWNGMKTRCYFCKPNDKNFKNYKGKNIKIYEEWYNSYIKFKKWALENGYKKGLHIHRKDSNKNYCPENCIFITGSQNSKEVFICRENQIKELKTQNWNLIQENLRLKVELELSNSIHNPLIINSLGVECLSK